MSSRFEDNFLRGYRKHVRFFNGWNKKAFPTLGEITQAGILEVTSKGEVFVAANREDIAEHVLETGSWKFNQDITYIQGFKGEKFTFASDDYYRMDGRYLSKFKNYWFTHRTVEDVDRQKIAFFLSNEPKIYEALANNFSLVKILLKLFVDESKSIRESCREHAVNMGDKDGFIIDMSTSEATAPEKFNDLFQSVGRLHAGNLISKKEWQCMELYCRGKTASQTSKILNISRRTVERRFEEIKDKLKIDSKAELFNLLRP